MSTIILFIIFAIIILAICDRAKGVKQEVINDIEFNQDLNTEEKEELIDNVESMSEEEIIENYEERF